MTSEPRVLVVDDEPLVREVLSRYLQREGFEVDVAADGEVALASFEAHRPDLVLLDLMLPRIDGLEVFRRIRSSAQSPVIMLTARGDTTDRVVGLGMGADDYVSKPFSPAEVVARVRAVLRRTAARNESAPVPSQYGRLRVDMDGHRVWIDDEEVTLTALEFRLLTTLIERSPICSVSVAVSSGVATRLSRVLIRASSSLALKGLAT